MSTHLRGVVIYRVGVALVTQQQTAVACCQHYCQHAFAWLVTLRLCNTTQDCRIHVGSQSSSSVFVFSGVFLFLRHHFFLCLSLSLSLLQILADLEALADSMPKIKHSSSEPSLHYSSHLFVDNPVVAMKSPHPPSHDAAGAFLFHHQGELSNPLIQCSKSPSERNVLTSLKLFGSAYKAV